MQLNETLFTLAKQINAKELSFAKFKLLADNNKNQITLMKGKKFLRINYNKGSDLYDIQKGKIKNFDIVEEDLKTGFYSDMLKEQIQQYFNFEYVMENLRIIGVNY